MIGLKVKHLPAVLAGLLVLALSAAPSLAQCTSSGSIVQWRCWEQQIASNVDFYNNGAGNPYRDLTLRVTFTKPATGQTFTQDAFWLADTASATTAKNFKVRTALPPGTWSWQVAGCTGTTGGLNCANNVTWTPSSGSITVSSSTSGPQIYSRGFPSQWVTFLGDGTTRYSNLLYADLVTPFLWSADTAWSAPGFEASGQTNLWGSQATAGSYVYERKNKSFNVVLVAPAATYQTWPWSTGTKPFVPDCSPTPVPNDCSRPNPGYWNNFDTMISNANQAGIVPLIAGLIDPLDTADGSNYPRQANVVDFARYLAARMAGFAVFFSPGFDDRLTDTTSQGTSLQTVMNAVGPALQQAAPRHLITNHLRGKSTCSDYDAFRTSTWMTFFLFQSGHGFGLPTSPDPPNTPCPVALSSTETPVQAALRRSWQMPWTLATSNSSTIKPGYNSEGPYDNICLQTPGCTCPGNAPMWCRSYNPNHGANFGADFVDIRYHNRHAAFESLLSGAYGFTYGSQEIAHWYFNLIPFSSALNGLAVADMTSVYQNFNTRAGLPPHRDWITNNDPVPDNGGDKKMALASDGSSLVLAYLPAGTANTINISTTNLPSLACSGTGWTYTWIHAQNNLPIGGSIVCSGTNPVQVTKPPTSACPVPVYDPQACDWVLQIQKTGAFSAQTQQAVSGQTLDVWADLSPQDGTSAIYASLATPGTGLRSKSILVSPSGLAFQQSPRIAPIRDGYLVVWQADGLDGSLLGVFAQRLDQKGQQLGSRLQVNTTTEQDQRDPALDSDPLGNTVVAWSSYGQDSDSGGIYARVLDPDGQPVTSEIQVNTVNVGHQEAPQVIYLPGGNFAVAWPTRPMEDVPGTLSFRVFSRTGAALTDEVRIPGQVGVTSRLVDVAATITGGLRIRWGLDDPNGVRLGLFRQDFSVAGNAVGPATSLP